ncbi:hypothetical protein M0813_08667 [Anaeramoeba flamelloides]|uniref:Uncharacterized protein n=1 Tax=Anaeramoeba flamelloides TaxID=1746091 RepID=A0AAV7YJ77_9EUKA|nr:hypothetical protein M0812_27111 [Anaeramoeba flamelloides]KAJ6228630.1 hypothetical protein M0813_08667 [Anaeramoeba flamelloides]
MSAIKQQATRPKRRYRKRTTKNCVQLDGIDMLTSKLQKLRSHIVGKQKKLSLEEKIIRNNLKTQSHQEEPNFLQEEKIFPSLFRSQTEQSEIPFIFEDNLENDYELEFLDQIQFDLNSENELETETEHAFFETAINKEQEEELFSMFNNSLQNSQEFNGLEYDGLDAFVSDIEFEQMLI